MASRKERHKRVISKDNDDCQPPAKRKKGVPEDQLKLERVLKCASSDTTILEKAKTNLKSRGGATSQQSNGKHSRAAVGPSKGTVSEKKSGAQKAVESNRIEEKRSKSISQKVKEKTIESPKTQSSQKNNRKNPKESEYFKKEKPVSGTTSKVSKVKEESKPEQKKPRIHDKKQIKRDSVSSSPSGSTKPSAKQKPTANIEAGSKRKSQSVKQESVKKEKSLKCVKEEKPAKIVAPKVDRKRKNAAESQISNVKRESPKKEPAYSSTSSPIKQQMIKQEDDSDSDESDWEEVEENVSPETSQVPSEPVTITLKGPDIMNRKRKKGSFDVEAFIRRRINRAEQELQLQMHKVHLLCLLSHGFHRNRLCKDEELLAVGLSVVPARLFEREYIFWDGNFLEKMVKWFHSTFTIAYDISENNSNLKATLLNRLATREAASEAELVFLLLIILRGMGCQVRLMTSLQPVSHKCAKKLKARKVKPVDEETQETEEPTATPAVEKTGPMDTTVMDLIKAAEAKHKSPKKPAQKTDKPKPKAEKASGETPKQKTKSLKRRTCASKVSYNDADDDDIECLTPGKAKTSRKNTDKDSNSTIEVLSSDSDFEEVPTKLRKSPSVARGKKSNKKVVSSDSDGVEVTKVVKTEKGTDYWLEVYLERAEYWIPVDCVRCRINNAGEIESRATQPVYYVLGYDNDNCIKDLTPRYSSGWLSTVRKLRRDEGWWEEVLDPFRARNKARDEAENMRMQTQQMKKPLPTSIGEFKNHPMYALKRHLLKFEAIYPSDATPVGFIRGEPVYARECVHDLHTRETWLKEGRAVRVKEKPYKLVKARKKRSKKSFETAGPTQEEPQSECFGRWQTEQYMPPPAYNGKVPRNEYGNVEVFKPWMIPAGAVHLQIPGLNKVARKLNIDCAPAMVGWDFHSGYTHPVLDGFIVCEEHKDLLLAAWDEQQEIEREKEAEKREKRALGNWKKMVKSLLIRERMKKRFDLQEAKTTADGTSKVEEKASDVQLAWPANRPAEVNKLSTADQTNLFPSEEI